MTPIEKLIHESREKLGDATPGPWTTDGHSQILPEEDHNNCWVVAMFPSSVGDLPTEQSVKNMTAIIHMKKTTSTLLDIIEAQETILKAIADIDLEASGLLAGKALTHTNELAKSAIGGEDEKVSDRPHTLKTSSYGTRKQAPMPPTVLGCFIIIFICAFTVFPIILFGLKKTVISLVEVCLFFIFCNLVGRCFLYFFGKDTP